MYVHVCVCACAHVCMYTCVYVYVHVCICVHVCMCMCMCVYVHMCVCVCACVCMCMCVYVHMCACTHVCMCMCMCVYVHDVYVCCFSFQDAFILDTASGSIFVWLGREATDNEKSAAFQNALVLACQLAMSICIF